MTTAPQPVCEDNDPHGYCTRAKDQICSATDAIGLQFARTHCAKTCELCVGMICILFYGDILFYFLDFILTVFYAEPLQKKIV